MFRRRRADLLILAVLFLLPLLLFWPVTLGGKTLLPADNLYQWQPWKSAAEQFNAQVPQNQLVSDLILENYAWKHFIVEAIAQRTVPLWNPYLFAGAPFLANGQHSAYYPFSLLFYVAAARYRLWLVHGGAVVPGGRVHVCLYARQRDGPPGQPDRRHHLSTQRFLYCQRGLHDDHRGGSVAAVAAGRDRIDHRSSDRSSGVRPRCRGSSSARSRWRARSWPGTSRSRITRC